MEKNPFKERWTAVETEGPQPRRLRKVVRVPFERFRRDVFAGDPGYVRETVDSFYSGDVFLLTAAFAPEFMKDVRERVFEWRTHAPSQHRKMLEGVDDFHRVVDPTLARSYSIETVRHTFYFFPWDDQLGLFPPVWERWSALKYFGGFGRDAYTAHTPKDGVVDRLVIAHYPPGSGHQETHSDPFLYQRAAMSTCMTKKGVDYREGGLYVIDGSGSELSIEDEIEVGDLFACYPTVLHGVGMIDPGGTTDWDDMRGRWFLGLSSVPTDIHAERHTGYGVDPDEYKAR